MAVEINGRSIAIFNVKGEYYGLLNRCPHRGAELCEGRFLPLITSSRPGEYHYDPEHALLACPWHGWEFDVTTGQSYFDPVGIRGRPYTVETENGALVAEALDRGELSMTPQQYAAANHGHYDENAVRQPGPYSAETIKVDVEDDYLVVDIRPQRPARTATEPAKETHA